CWVHALVEATGLVYPRRVAASANRTQNPFRTFLGTLMNLRNDPSTFSSSGIAAIGEPLRRSEDPKLLRGEGRYTDDLQLPNQAYCVMVRSRNGHGVIRALKTDAARRMPGVLAVYTGDDLKGYGLLKSSLPFKSRDGSEMRHTGRPAL